MSSEATEHDQDRHSGSQPITNNNTVEMATGGLRGISAVVVNASAYTIIASVFLMGMYWQRSDCIAVNEAYRAEIKEGRERIDKVEDRHREDAKERWKTVGEHTKAISSMANDVKVMSAAVNKVADKVGIVVGDIPRAPESKPKIAEGASLNGPMPKPEGSQ